MSECGKLIRFEGRVSSGKVVNCRRNDGHTESCNEFGEPSSTAVSTTISPEGTWPFPVGNPKGGGHRIPSGATKAPSINKLP